MKGKDLIDVCTKHHEENEENSCLNCRYVGQCVDFLRDMHVSHPHEMRFVLNEKEYGDEDL